MSKHKYATLADMQAIYRAQPGKGQRKLRSPLNTVTCYSAASDMLIVMQPRAYLKYRDIRV